MNKAFTLYLKYNHQRYLSIKKVSLIIDYVDYEIFNEVLKKTNTINTKEKETLLRNFYEYCESCLEVIRNFTPPALEDLLPFSSKVNFAEIKEKKLLLFDLDETLIYSDFTERGDFVVQITNPFTNVTKQIGVTIRPLFKELIEQIKDDFILILFTSSQKFYADAILKHLDPDNKIFQYRLYRNNCFPFVFGDTTVYIKDLRVLEGVDFKNVVIVDNSVLSFSFQLENGIPILNFNGNKEDDEFKYLLSYLKYLSKCEDIRVENNKIFKLKSFNMKNNSKLLETFMTEYSTFGVNNRVINNSTNDINRCGWNLF